MKELHAQLTRAENGTYTTNFLDEPPADIHPRDVIEVHGCRVGIYAGDDIEWNVVESIVSDAVAAYLGRRR